ncbi:hypothetical protein PILCRDRAFT_16329 [Piloderma croceum F 1598]|uniref:Uncharacterized protein n=1 Tax=Piloderma croceum (strain F 1598) TaxID=765440 RepID=A0A0C3EWU1_PILCF|nr:hypothetical protein PILCRDRAFT_16329 [Piloderma croceum F 1598]
MFLDVGDVESQRLGTHYCGLGGEDTNPEGVIPPNIPAQQNEKQSTYRAPGDQSPKPAPTPTVLVTIQIPSSPPHSLYLRIWRESSQAGNA